METRVMILLDMEFDILFGFIELAFTGVNHPVCKAFTADEADKSVVQFIVYITLFHLWQ